MATSKTLTPTNETISIPAMTDQPDASVFSNCIDKEADAINALNSNLSNVLTNTDLRSFAKSVRDGFTCFRYNNTVTNTPTQYGHGYIVKYGVNIRIVVFAMQLDETYTSYSYDSGTSWMNWDSYALNSNLVNIGSFIATTSSTESVASDGNFHQIASIAPGQGYYLVIANVSFQANAAGSRGVSLAIDTSVADSGWFVNVLAADIGSAALQIVRFQAFNQNQTMNLVVRQNSGSNLDVTHRIFAIKLHS